MNLSFVSLTKETEPLWEEFCGQNNGAWFFHTLLNLKILEAYRPSAETMAKHFFINRGQEIIGVCPLGQERLVRKGGVYKAFSLGEDFLPSPVLSDQLSPNDRDRVKKALLEHLDELAHDQGVARISFREMVLVPKILSPSVAPLPDFSQPGFLDMSIPTQVVDLRAKEEDLWCGVRDSYHSLIRRMEERLNFRMLDGSSLTHQDFETYRALHFRASGRLTRPLVTFELMEKWILENKGFLAEVRSGDKVISCAIVAAYKNKAYYASAADEPEEAGRYAAGHLLQWRVMLALKQRGFTHYELGWQVKAPTLAYLPTEKEVQIAFFKRGFGGATVPFFRTAKYYNPQLFQEEIGGLVSAVAERCGKHP